MASKQQIPESTDQSELDSGSSEARVTRVVIAAADPTALAGGGARHLADYGVQVDFSVEEAAALELNAPFFSRPQTRPDPG